MKTISNILATIIVALFLLSFGMKSEAVGQPCTSMLDTLIIEGCPYVVEICVYCGLSYPGYVRVDNVEPIDPNCSSGLTQPELIQRVFAELNTPTALWLEYCQPLLPPCSGTERKLVNWRIPLCWNSQLKYIIPPSPPEQPNVRYEYYTRPCDDENYCTVQYEYCVDALGAIQYEVNSYILTGFPDCEDAENIILPIITGQTSDCFIYHTPCNP